MAATKIDLSAGMIPNKPKTKDKPAPALQKGAPVTLPDGSKGKVMHMVQNMTTVRVQLDDGRKVHVRAKALTVDPHVMVTAHTRRIPEK